jgi:hypothetical protein
MCRPPLLPGPPSCIHRVLVLLCVRLHLLSPNTNVASNKESSAPHTLLHSTLFPHPPTPPSARFSFRPVRENDVIYVSNATAAGPSSVVYHGLRRWFVNRDVHIRLGFTSYKFNLI